MLKAKIWLCVPPFALCMLDQGITLVGQSSDYWAGNRAVAVEGNPWFHWLLRQHPLAFEAGIAVWVCVFSLIIFALPRRGAMTLSIAIVLGHTWGAATWICWVLPYGYWFALVLFLVSAVLIVATWVRFGQSCLITCSPSNLNGLSPEDGNQAHHEVRVLIARRRNGNEVVIPPDLDQKLSDIIDVLKAGKSLDEAIIYESGSTGPLVSVSSTWARLVSELILEFERVPGQSGAYRDPLLTVLAILASEDKPNDCWRRVRGTILDNIDMLCGWSVRGRGSFTDDIERRGDVYFATRDGEEVEIIGSRTSAETRWDFIFDDVKRDHGLLKSILRVVALRNACVDFRQNPDGYPEAIRLRLSENQDGRTSFLHWHWEIPWPYERRYLPWTPECSQCNVGFLADDLLAWFSDREHLPVRDTLTIELSDDVQEFEEKTKDFPRQHEIALDTDLIIGDTPEVWFEFRGHPIRWINRTPHMLATLVIPAPNSQDAGPIYKLALEFISALVFKVGHHHIRTVASCGSGRRRLPLLRQPNQYGGLKIPTLPELPSDYASGSRKALAVSLFAEGINSESVYYSFLNYYKVIESAHSGVKANVIQWINDGLDAIQLYSTPERVAELRHKFDNVGDYLYVSNRCAVAHASAEPIADPDNPGDRRRLTLDLPIVQALARKAIEDGLFDDPPDAGPEETKRERGR